MVPLYGMTEAAGIITTNTERDRRIEPSARRCPAWN